jgi:hypothetical protein
LRFFAFAPRPGCKLLARSRDSSFNPLRAAAPGSGHASSSDQFRAMFRYLPRASMAWPQLAAVGRAPGVLGPSQYCSCPQRGSASSACHPHMPLGDAPPRSFSSGDRPLTRCERP